MNGCAMRKALATLFFTLMTLIALAVQAPQAVADPLPGFDLSPATLQQRMDDCLAGIVDDKFVLMGWVNLQTGQQRRWRCSSLKHMYVRSGGGTVHDPFSDVVGFMKCLDRIISHGFPRPGDPGNTRVIYQYRGTAQQAVVVVNDASGDVVTAWTTPAADDWTTCAGWAP